MAGDGIMFSSSKSGTTATIAAARADPDELHYAVGPPHRSIHCILSGIKRLSEALADDDDSVLTPLYPHH